MRLAQTHDALCKKYAREWRGNVMTMIHDPAVADPVLRQCANNLFRNKQRSKLFCAVREDYPVPSFIDAEAWSFERVLRSHDLAPSGFHGSSPCRGAV